MLGQRGEGSIHLRGTCQWWLVSEPLRRDQGTGSGKIVRVVIKKLNDGVPPDGLKRLALP
jgi:hypothetical protein